MPAAKRSIEYRAREYVNAPCNWDCINCPMDTISCRFYNDKESFKAGILDERQKQKRRKINEACK